MSGPKRQQPDKSPITKEGEAAARKDREMRLRVEMNERFSAAAIEAEGAAALATALPLQDPVLPPDELAKLEAMRDRAAKAEAPQDAT
jgi:hypothetical protein